MATNDNIKSPRHYEMFGRNTITILASAMTIDEWRGFCFGNALKYRIRLGKKDSIESDLAKANYYEELFELHKSLCKGG